MDKDFKRVLFSYLDSQDFIQIKKDDNIYFVNSENDQYAQIRFDKEDGWCYIDYDLIEEISSFFSLQSSDSEQVIGKWVENTLQMKVTFTPLLPIHHRYLVENTLQMKVKDTRKAMFLSFQKLRIPN